MSKQHGKFDKNASNVTPYDVMRLQNCKAYTYRQREMYPSIRPPQSRCRTDFTDKWISNVAENTGCKPFDPKLYSNKNVAPVENVLTQRRVDKPSSGKYLCSQIKLPKRNLDYSKLTPNDLMRLLNCNPADFRDDEIYPSIRPPVSKCCPALTADYLIDKVKEAGCERHFDMEKDDIVEVWRQSPNKESLSYYGVDSGIYKPEAIMFNEAISKCLQVVNPQKPFKPKELSKFTLPSGKLQEPHKHSILDRSMLSGQVSRMPTVQEAVNAVGVLRWVFCSHDEKEPFIRRKSPFPIKKALKMERPRSKSMHELRRKDKFGECHIPENTCTQFEWMKYKENQKSYEEKYKQEMLALENEWAMEMARKSMRNKEQEMNLTDLKSADVGPRGISVEEDIESKYLRLGETERQLVDEDSLFRAVSFGSAIYKIISSETEDSEYGSQDLKENIILPHGVDAGGLVPRKGKKKASSGKSKANRLKRESGQPKNYEELFTALVPIFMNTENKSRQEIACRKHVDFDYISVALSPSDSSESSSGNDKKIGTTTGKQQSSVEDKKEIEKVHSKRETGKKTSKKGVKKGEHDVSREEDKKGGHKGNHKGDHKGDTKGDTKGDPKGDPKRDHKEDKMSDYVEDNGLDKYNINAVLKPTIKDKRKSDTDTEYLSSTSSIEDNKKTKKKLATKQKGEKKKNIQTSRPSQKNERNGSMDDQRIQKSLECPCETCKLMRRRQSELNTPFITQLKRADKRRQLREYYRFMCYREQLDCRKPEYPAPQHKCDPIVCEDFFCKNPKISKYCDCLMAMQELQDQLGSKNHIIKNELIFNLEDLKNSLCERFSE